MRLSLGSPVVGRIAIDCILEPVKRNVHIAWRPDHYWDLQSVFGRRLWGHIRGDMRFRSFDIRRRERRR